MSARLAGAGFALAALTLVVLYLPALPGPLLLDDYSSLSPLFEFARQGGDWRALVFGTSGPSGRPLALLSFLANAALSADLRWWKATNLALHVLNGVLVWRLYLALFAVGGVAAPRARLVAVLAAALWLLHPLHLSTVMYTVQRMSELSALFCLLGLLLYVHGRQAMHRRGGQLAVGAAFLLCTPLAVLAKETGMLLPLMLLALELLLFSGQAPRPRWLLVLFALCAVAPAVLGPLWLLADLERHLLNGYAVRDFTPGQRLLTEPGIVLRYLAMIVVPQRLLLGFHHDDIALARSVFEPATALACLAMLGLLVGSVLGRQRAPLVALGIALFAIGHLLESTVFGLELMYEHRNYLPSVGIVLALAALGERLSQGRAVLVAASLFGLLLAFTTAGQARLWGDEGRLYAYFVDVHPASPRARVTFAEWLITKRAWAAAHEVLADAPGLVPALHRLRLACAEQAPPPPDAAAILAAAAHAPRLDLVGQDTLVLLAREVETGRCALPAAALSATLEGVLRGAMRVGMRYRVTLAAARLHHARGEHAIAWQQLERATGLDTRDPFPCYLAAEWAADAGELAQARERLACARARSRRHHGDFSAIDKGVTALLAR